MGEAENRATVERLQQLLEAGDMAALGRAQQELTADDFVQEWPQSGERIRGRDNARAVDEHYAEATGTKPAFRLRRIVGGGAAWTIEGSIDYGDGTPVSYVGVVELRDGKIARQTEYFGNPFPAPAWRAQWVEPMS